MIAVQFFFHISIFTRSLLYLNLYDDSAAMTVENEFCKNVEQYKTWLKSSISVQEKIENLFLLIFQINQALIDFSFV